MIKKFKLSELGEFKNGANYPKGSYGKGDKIVNVKDLFRGRFIIEHELDELKKDTLANKEIYLVKHGDILFTRSSLVRSGAGMCAMMNNPTQDILFCGFIIRYRLTNENVYPLYLLYLLRSPQYRKLFTGNQQTNITNINQDTLGDIVVYLPVDDKGIPDYNKQKDEISIIDHIDSLIETNEQMNIDLLDTIKLIYNQWFTKFDYPFEKCSDCKSKSKKIYNEVLKINIPESWKVQNLKVNDLTKICNPGILKFDGNKEYVATGDVDGNSILSRSLITYEIRESRANMQPLANSVWFAKMKNSIKHIFVGSYSDNIINNIIFSTGFLGLYCLKEEYLEYIYSFLNFGYFEKVKDRFAHGATQEAVNNDDVSLIPIIIPDYFTLKEYHERTKHLLHQIYINNQKNKVLINEKEKMISLILNTGIINE